MISKRFEDVEFSDIEALLNNEVAESKTLEYKREISSNEKLLAGVSALANTVGGDFIIGIEAKDGIPINLKGVSFSNADDEILRLEQILQTGLEPRLQSQNIKNIQSPNGDNFIFIRVNRSWIAPHRIKCKDKDYNDKFYGRHSSGKYPMDVSELRTVFMLTEQLTERIKNFRRERIQKIQSNEEIPALLNEGGKIILHLLPLNAFATSDVFDIFELNKKIQFSPISSNSWDKRINLDGIVVSRRVDSSTNSYTQVFRNGCIEAVNCLSWNEDDKDYSSRYDEEQIIKALSEYQNFYSDLGIELPIYFFLTIVDIKDYKFHLDDDFHRIYEVQYRMRGDDKPFIDRNNLMLPDITIQNLDLPAAEILQPAFNLIWNSVGFTRDFNYDENGKWIEDLRNFYRN
jgi:hypothetical protein